MQNPPVTTPTPKRRWLRWLLFAILGVFSCCMIGFVIAIFSPDQPTSTATSDSNAPTTTAPTSTVVATVSATIAPTEMPTATPSPAPTSAPTASPVPVASMPVDDYLAMMVSKTLGYTTNYDEPRLVEVKMLFGATADQVGYRLVTIRANNNITNNLIVAGMLVDAVDYYSAIAQNPEVMKLDSITILFTMPMVDKYGNVQEVGVNRIMLTTDTMRQINWDLFKNGGHRRLVDAADKYVLNPSFR